MAGSLALGRSAHAAGSDMIKIGLIGCGGRGTGAAANAMNAGQGRQAGRHGRRLRRQGQEQPRASCEEAKPDQVAVDDDHCFVGFDGYKKVIASDVDVVLIACRLGVPSPAI